MGEVTIITRSGERKTFKTPEGRRTVISSEGVQTKTVRVPVKGQKDSAIVPRKVVDSREFTDVTGEPVETVTATRTVNYIGPGSKDYTQISGRSPTAVPTRYGRGTITATTRPSGIRGISSDISRISRNLQASSEKSSSPVKSQIYSYGSFGLGVVSGGINVVTFGYEAVTKPKQTGKNLLTAVSKPRQTFGVIGPKLRSDTAYFSGQLVGEVITTKGIIKGGSSVGGRTISELRYATSRKVPIEDIADTKVVAGQQRLNVGYASAKQLESSFNVATEFGPKGKTSLFFSANKITGKGVIKANRDLEATGVGITSVSPPTKGSPQFAFSKGNKLSSGFTGENLAGDISLLPVRKQSTGIFFETEKGFFKLPGDTNPISYSQSRKIIGSTPKSRIVESPKFARLRGGRAEQEGGIQAGLRTEEIKTDFYRQSVYNRLLGGSGVATRFQGKPITIRGFRVLEETSPRASKGFVSGFTGRNSSISSDVVVRSSAVGSGVRSFGGRIFSSSIVGSKISGSRRVGGIFSRGSFSSSSSLGSTRFSKSAKSSVSSSSFGRSSFSSLGSSSFGPSLGSSFSSGRSSFSSLGSSSTTKIFTDIKGPGKIKYSTKKVRKQQIFLPTSNLVGLTVGKGIKVKTGKELLPGLGLARLKA